MKAPPYINYLKDKKLKGNARFEGYLIDLLERLASFGNFTYTLSKVGDEKYGKFENNKWVGMIGELVNMVRIKLIFIEKILTF